MPLGGNTNQSIFGKNPFVTTNTGFTPTDMSGTRFAGLNVPQVSARPLNSEVSGIRRTGDDGGPTSVQDEIRDLIGDIPRQTLPYVPPSQVPQIQGFQQTAEALAQFGRPLLQGILADLVGRYGMAQQAFGPEMELRKQMLGLLEGRDNRLLQDLIAMQQQIAEARENMRPRSGGFFFKGF